MTFPIPDGWLPEWLFWEAGEPVIGLANLCRSPPTAPFLFQDLCAAHHALA